jgi:rhodanese-related sulfurtransferase
MEHVLKSMTLEFFGKGMHKITPEKLFASDAAVFLDVRSNEEVQSMPFPLGVHKNVESLHVPINEIPERLNEIPPDKSVAVFCPAHVRASIVYAYLRSKGYEQVRVLEGGYAALTDALKPGKILAAI